MGKLIGLSGYARSGKNTVADILTSEADFVQVSFAQPMRDALYALNPIVDNESGTARLQDIVDWYGWDGYKESLYGAEIRALLQRFGTEVGRDMFSPNFWVDRAFDGISRNFNTVITDVRFENEAEEIKRWGGEIWRVRRPGIFPTNNHASETGMDDWDYDVVIDNNGTLEDLEAIVRGYI